CQRLTLRTKLMMVAHHPPGEVAYGGSGPLGRCHCSCRTISHVRFVEQRHDVGVRPVSRRRGRASCHRRRIGTSGTRRGSRIRGIVLFLGAGDDRQRRNGESREPETRSTHQHCSYPPNQVVRKKTAAIIEAAIIASQVTRAKSVRTNEFLKCWQCSVSILPAAD